uniref:Uncharacterized protein n=1 Tax=uncultured Gemmatimonadales bacterium HF4000_15H13 TaxID=723618 RepID=E7C892_9BACT|nr:hypothetical protein [uncultured Gemmatimonadales bacterium HF4000_15H13]
MKGCPFGGEIWRCLIIHSRAPGLGIVNRDPPNDSVFLLRAMMLAAHAVCDPDVDPASSECLLDLSDS